MCALRDTIAEDHPPGDTLCLILLVAIGVLIDVIAAFDSGTIDILDEINEEFGTAGLELIRRPRH
jgi:hypothetical protein